MTERSTERPETNETASGPRRWLERIRINRFRSVEPGTELRFSEGFHVVLGKNTTGKSTLLDLIAASLAIDFDRSMFRDEPLDIEFTLRAGDLCFEATVKRVLRDANASDVLGNAKEQHSVRDEGRYVLRAPSGLKVAVVLNSDDVPRRTVEGIDPARYGLDEPLETRHQRSPLSPGLDGLYNLWFQGSSRASESITTLVGGDAFLVASFYEPFRMSEGDELLYEFEDSDSFAILSGSSFRSRPDLLPGMIFAGMSLEGSAVEVSLALELLLSAFVCEMGFSEARMSLGPPRVERHFGQDAFVYTAPTFTFYRDGRLVRRIDQLSYGQRRLFALGWYLACARDVAILDEPSNGLHESWIEFLVSQLHDRQVFLTSQNRELLDMLPFTTETELSRGFVLCESRSQPGGDEPTLHWRGLRENEAALLTKALKASRVDLITDLLRALDLW